MNIHGNINPSISSVFARRPQVVATSANERQILELLRRQTGASRADLARSTGLTNQSLSRIIEDLSGRGLVKLGPSEAKGRGQPSSPVLICPEGAYTVGVSLMTDALTLVIMDFDGQIVCDHTERIDMSEIECVLEAVGDFINLAIASNALNRERLLGIGVAITGYFIGDGAKVNPPAQLEAWALTDVIDLFQKRFNLPVWMDNDGNAAAVGESLNGIGKGIVSFAYLFFSVGFGGGIVLDRKLYRGLNGNAGEFASILAPGAMSPNLESLRIYISEAGRDYASLGALLENFDPAWQGVEQWVEAAVPSLNTVISAISAIVDVDAIVLGGRIPRALANLLIPRLTYFNPPRRSHQRPVPKILCSAVDKDAATIGAAALPLKALFYG